MPTQVYGASDDLIEFDGDVHGEVGCYGTDDSEDKPIAFFSDGTVLKIAYCLNVPGVWGIAVLRKGTLFDKIDPCDDEDADPHSDLAHFKDGLKWAYFAREWEEVA